MMIEALPSLENMRANTGAVNRYRWQFLGTVLVFIFALAWIGEGKTYVFAASTAMIIGVPLAIADYFNRLKNIRESGIRVNGDSVQIWSPRWLIDTNPGPHLRIVDVWQMDGGFPVNLRIHDIESGCTVVLKQILFNPDELYAAIENLTPHQSAVFFDKSSAKVDPIFKPCLPWLYRHARLITWVVALGLILGGTAAYIAVVGLENL